MRSSIFPLVLVAVLALGGFGFFFLGSTSSTSSSLTPVSAPGAERPESSGPAPVAAPAPPADALADDEAEAPQRVEVTATPSGGERYGDWSAGEHEVAGRVELPAGVPADDDLWILALAERVPPPQLYGAGALFDPEMRRKAKGGVVAAERVAADGSFRVAFPAELEEGWLVVGGRYLFSKDLEQVALPATTPVAIAPQVGAYVTLDVALPSGLSAPDEVLEALSVVLGPDSSQFSMMNMDAAWMFRRTAVHEGGGRFVLRGVDSARPYELEVRSATLANHVEESVQLEAGRERRFDVRMLRGGRIAGRVVDEDGAAVADARVRARRTVLWGMPGGTLARTRSGADGTFEMSGIPPGKARLTAERDGLLESGPAEVEVADEELITNVELALERGNHVAGVVRYADGRPLAGIEVELGFDPAAMAGMTAFNMSRGADGKDRTDEQGRFRVTGLGRGPFQLTATLEADAEGEVWSARKSGVQPNTDDVELLMTPRPGFAGRVVDADGLPVTAFRVKASTEGAVFWAPGQGRTEDFEDEEGRFRIAGLEAGAWEFRVDAAGFATSAPVKVNLPLAPGTEPSAFVLFAGGSAAGRVVDSFGNAVSGALVTLSVSTDKAFARLTGDLDLPETYADEEGAFLLTELSPGTTALLARHPDHSESLPVSLEVLSGQATTDVLLTLRSGGVLSGEVYDKEGEPAAGAQLIVQDTSNWETVMDRVEDDGTFRLTKLRAGKWQVTAMLGSMDPGSGDDGTPDMSAFMENMRFTVVEVEEGEETHVVLGAPPEDPVHVHGQVTHAGEPVAGAMVSFLPEDGEGFQSMKFTQLDAKGEYAVDLDEPGAYLVQVQSTGLGSSFAQNSLEFPRTVPTGDDHRLDFELPVARISGRVEDDDGQALGGARVTLTTDGGVTYGTFMGGQYAETTTDDAGNFTFDYIRPGTYSVAAGGSMFGGAFGSHSKLGRIVREGIEVGEGDAIDGIDFRLQAAGEITGQVLDSGGKPLSGAAVFVRDGAGRLLERFSMIASGPDGSFRYTGVSPGRYTVQARTSEFVSAQAIEVEVRAGEPVQTTLVVQPGTILLVSITDLAGNDVRARVSVKDSRGREINGMLAFAEIMSGSTNFSSREQRVGPVPPDRYVVVAVADDGRTVQKPVVLNGQAERRVRLRLR